MKHILGMKKRIYDKWLIANATAVGAPIRTESVFWTVFDIVLPSLTNVV